MLYLAGDAGDDTFVIETFLELKQNPNKPDEVTNLTTLFGGTGSNRYQYVQDAPVLINGGSGYDTIIIVGTPLDDTFIITDTYVAGPGGSSRSRTSRRSRSTAAAATTTSGCSPRTRTSPSP